jgi:hypothetical protein
MPRKMTLSQAMPGKTFVDDFPAANGAFAVSIAFFAIGFVTFFAGLIGLLTAPSAVDLSSTAQAAFYVGFGTISMYVSYWIGTWLWYNWIEK